MTATACALPILAASSSRLLLAFLGGASLAALGVGLIFLLGKRSPEGGELRALSFRRALVEGFVGSGVALAGSPLWVAWSRWNSWALMITFGVIGGACFYIAAVAPKAGWRSLVPRTVSVAALIIGSVGAVRERGLMACLYVIVIALATGLLLKRLRPLPPQHAPTSAMR